VVSNVTQPVIDRIRPRLTAVTALGEGRFSLELPLTVAPQQLLAEIDATGGHLVSLNPVRETLEDFFVQQVRATDEAGIVRERTAS